MELHIASVKLEDKVKALALSSEVRLSTIRKNDILCYIYDQSRHIAIGCARGKKVYLSRKKQGFILRTCPKWGTVNVALGY